MCGSGCPLSCVKSIGMAQSKLVTRICYSSYGAVSKLVPAAARSGT
jgi:hypothetical protein